ncbi:MAG: Polyhydroxyalkanoate granule-associated protein PhaF, partial [uncultured Ramlibacter sp.]
GQEDASIRGQRRRQEERRPVLQHRQGVGQPDLAGGPGRLRQGAGGRRQGVRHPGEGRPVDAAQDPERRRGEAVRGHHPHGQHGHRPVLARLGPVGQARDHFRGARVQGAEQAGRALGQGRGGADRPHRRTQSQRGQAERPGGRCQDVARFGRRQRCHQADGQAGRAQDGQSGGL